MALGLTSAPRAMTDARTAALTRTAVTLAVMTAGESPASPRGDLDLAGPRDRGEDERIGVVGREQAGPRQEQGARRLGRAQVQPVGGAERDVAAIEAAEWQAQPQALGQEGEVVGSFGRASGRRSFVDVARSRALSILRRYARQVATRCRER